MQTNEIKIFYVTPGHKTYARESAIRLSVTLVRLRSYRSSKQPIGAYLPRTETDLIVKALSIFSTWFVRVKYAAIGFYAATSSYAITYYYVFSS